MPLTQVDQGLLSSTAQYTGFKNRLINGGMTIDQRNAGASVTNPAGASYVVDRFVIQGSVASKFTGQQNAGSVTPPAGFINYLGLTSSSAYTPGSSEFYMCQQWIEGLNAADLGWGTANAQTVTVSFWVRSSLTGTFAGSLNNSNYSRSYPFTFSIPSANTWTQITRTIAGDTSGTWLTTNGRGIGLHFNMGAGSSMQGTANAWNAGFFISTSGATNVVSTSGATLYITGVQLEVGSTATSFDYRPYGTELQLCQRYYFAYAVPATCPQGFGAMQSTTAARIIFPNPVPMRATPTFTSLGSLGIASGGTSFIASASSVLGISSAGVQMQFDVSGATTHQTCVYRDSGGVTFSAEL
jgi:hypothetical protein